MTHRLMLGRAPPHPRLPPHFTDTPFYTCMLYAHQDCMSINFVLRFSQPGFGKRNAKHKTENAGKTQSKLDRHQDCGFELTRVCIILMAKQGCLITIFYQNAENTVN